MEQLTKSVIMRFVRAFLAGAVANMAVMLPFTGNSWKEVGMWIAILTMSGCVGGISGCIMAGDKYFRGV